MSINTSHILLQVSLSWSTSLLSVSFMMQVIILMNGLWSLRAWRNKSMKSICCWRWPSLTSLSMSPVVFPKIQGVNHVSWQLLHRDSKHWLCLMCAWSWMIALHELRRSLPWKMRKIRYCWLWTSNLSSMINHLQHVLSSLRTHAMTAESMDINWSIFHMRSQKGLKRVAWQTTHVNLGFSLLANVSIVVKGDIVRPMWGQALEVQNEESDDSETEWVLNTLKWGFSLEKVYWWCDHDSEWWNHDGWVECQHAWWQYCWLDPQVKQNMYHGKFQHFHWAYMDWWCWHNLFCHQRCG